jgi:hypothetical protein
LTQVGEFFLHGENIFHSSSIATSHGLFQVQIRIFKHQTNGDNLKITSKDEHYKFNMQ